jgi:hypothetical protein
VLLTVNGLILLVGERLRRGSEARQVAARQAAARTAVVSAGRGAALEAGIPAALIGLGAVAALVRRRRVPAVPEPES